jgi:O-acetyl-ADP-ribose deacetylase
VSLKIRVYQGSITDLNVEAVVNAANASLLGGGGVDGAIHRAAGEQLLEECRSLGGCQTGDAKITRGYKLRAKFVIHAVGPVWHGGIRREPELLASCYRRCLVLARDHGIRSVAFPAISTGAYGYPMEEAAKIAVTTVLSELEGSEEVDEVVFACFDGSTFAVYGKLLAGKVH